MDILYLPGSSNLAADALSRFLVFSVSLDITFDDLALQQQQSDKVRFSCTAITGMHLADVVVTLAGPSLLCDLSSGTSCSVVPPGARHQVFDLLHGLSHLDVHVLQHLVIDMFVWHGMKHDIAFTHIHIDLIGPLPSSHDFMHLFTIVNRFTQRAEAVPVTSATAEVCPQALPLHWVS